MQLLRRREILWPTRIGWLTFIFLSTASTVFILLFCESFLSVTSEVEPDVLVVECWIGKRGIEAAGEEFQNNPYNYIVLVGGETRSKWDEKSWNHSEYSRKLLEKAYPTIPQSKIITVTNDFVVRHRTYGAALAVFDSLENLPNTKLTIFTEGAHTRRSRLVYRRVFPNNYNVGSLSWKPASIYSGLWFTSSGRAKNLMEEAVGYLYECIFYSGRILSEPSRS